MLDLILKPLNLECYAYDMYTDSIILNKSSENCESKMIKEILNISGTLDNNNIPYLIDDMSNIGVYYSN